MATLNDDDALDNLDAWLTTPPDAVGPELVAAHPADDYANGRDFDDDDEPAGWDGETPIPDDGPDDDDRPYLDFPGPERDFDAEADDESRRPETHGMIGDFDLASIRLYGRAADVAGTGVIALGDCLTIEAARMNARGDRVARWIARKLLELADDARVFGTRI